MAESSESLCARCAALGKTCCQETQVFLTYGDVERITAAVGARDFWERAAPDAEAFAAGAALDPEWGGMVGADGKRRVIRHAADGKCCFLTATGCELSLETRPLVCRLYPFDYNGTTIKGVYGHLCPEAEAASGPLLLALLGMNRDAGERWRQLLYAEMAEEFAAGDANETKV